VKEGGGEDIWKGGEDIWKGGEDIWKGEEMVAKFVMGVGVE
jgi:hypothetical protein